MKKIVINECYGGFGLSDLAYKKLVEYGIPVRKYIEEKRNPKTGLYDIKEPNNEGEVIFDRELTPKGENKLNDLLLGIGDGGGFEGRYWETWLRDNRSHPLLIKVVKELGKKANNKFSELKIVKIPDNVEYEIDEYDGIESVHEKHRVWD